MAANAERGPQGWSNIVEFWAALVIFFGDVYDIVFEGFLSVV